MVWVHAHVRGGGEGGRRWWLDGRLEHKQHTFDDLVAVADGAGGRCVDGSRIATRGLSAGGLLQGAVFSQRPDRWRAVVAEVPFVDVVTTMFDASIPLTITEWDEWGDPRRKEDFDWMLAYSPYDNPPPAGGRPDLLVTGAVHDPRVMVREPAKWVAGAARRPTRSGRRAACSACELGAGAHVGPSGRFGHLAYEAEVARLDPRPAGSCRERRCTRRSLRGRPSPDPDRHQQRPGRLLGRRPATRPAAAAYLRDYLTGRRGRLRAGRPRPAPGQPGGPAPRHRTTAPSLAFVGHTDVVPVDPRDWTHPPFAARRRRRRLPARAGARST